MNMISCLLSILRWPLKFGIGGGSGGSGSNVTEWKPLEELRPYHQQIVSEAANLAAQPYSPYPYNRVADMNDTQKQGLQYAADLAKSGSPATAAASNMTLNTLTGAYQNPFATSQTAVGQNDFMGINNPYLRGMISSGQESLADQYRYAVAPNTNAMYAMGNAYGGTAHLEQQKMQQDQLLKAMSGIESQYGNQAYQQSANLAESAIDRGVQAQQSDRASATNSWEAERARQMAAAPQAIGLYQNDLNSAKTLTGVGDALQQQQQSVYDDLANEWARSQAYPQTQLDSFLNTLIRASGGFGTNTQTSTQNTSINPASALLGGGLMGYSLMGG
jgi:hypothetical protein